MTFTEKTVFKTARACTPVYVELECICGGHYVTKDIKVENKYLATCDKCGDEIYTFGEYPHIDYQPFGRDPVYSEHVLAFVEEKEKINEI